MLKSAQHTNGRWWHTACGWIAPLGVLVVEGLVWTIKDFKKDRKVSLGTWVICIVAAAAAIYFSGTWFTINILYAVAVPYTIITFFWLVTKIPVD